MDEFSWQITGRNPFSKGPTKNKRGRKLFFWKVSEWKVRRQGIWTQGRKTRKWAFAFNIHITPWLRTYLFFLPLRIKYNCIRPNGSTLWRIWLHLLKNSSFTLKELHINFHSILKKPSIFLTYSWKIPGVLNWGVWISCNSPIEMGHLNKETEGFKFKISSPCRLTQFPDPNH